MNDEGGDQLKPEELQKVHRDGLMRRFLESLRLPKIEVPRRRRGPQVSNAGNPVDWHDALLEERKANAEETKREGGKSLQPGQSKLVGNKPKGPEEIIN